MACELVQTLRIIPEQRQWTSSKDHRYMNWQLISFFGDSTVLLPSAARRCLLSRCCVKRHGLLAWQWSLLVRHHRRHRLRLQTGLCGLGAGYSRAGLHRLPAATQLSAAFWPIFLWLLSACFSAGLQSSGRHRLYSGRWGGVFTTGHPCAFRLEVIAGLLLGAVGSALFLLLQNVPPIRKTCVFPGRSRAGMVPLIPVA